MRADHVGSVASIAALLGALASGSVFAQGGEGAAQGELGVKAEAALTTDQMLERADATQRRATQLGERLTRMLDEARRDRDILRANCVNRKLTEVNANARNVEQRAKALRDAIESKDDGRAGHEYTVLSVLSQKLDSLGQEAAQCLGQAAYEAGPSQVVTTVPANAPTINPSVIPAAPPPPPAVSVPPFTEPISPAS